MEVESWSRFFGYVGCALGIALAGTTPALTLSVYWCISLLFTEP